MRQLCRRNDVPTSSLLSLLLLLAACCAAVTQAAVVSGSEDEAEAIAPEAEAHWDGQAKKVMDAIAEAHHAELEKLEGGFEGADDEARETRRVLRRNVAVQLYRLVTVHPLGDGKRRIRQAFEASKLRRVFFWVCNFLTFSFCLLRPK